MINAFKSISIFIILIIFAELLVRNTITSPISAISDEELGWIFEPHSSIFHTSEGWATNTMNSMGFNDQEININPDKQNILVLGDSYTEALQVRRSENFTFISEKALLCTDFINAGRSALSPIQYPIILDRFVEKFPIYRIIIVLTYSDLMDIVNNNAAITRNSSNGDITNITLREKKMHWLKEKTAIVFAHSALATYLKDRVKSYLKSKKKSVGQVIPDPLNKESENAKYVSDILTYVFNKLNNESKLSVLYIPNLTFHPEGISKQTEESQMFEDLIRENTKLNNIDFLSAQKEMQSSYKKLRQPPVGFPNKTILSGHLNKVGHQDISLAIQKLIKIDCFSL